MQSATPRRLLGLLVLALALALPASAQPILTAFGTVLGGENEVPPNASTGVGLTAVIFVDNPDPTPDGIIVRGGFDDLMGDYQASHLHKAPAGSNGGVVVALSATVHGDMRGGEWEEGSNTFPAPAGFLADLQAGLIYVNVHSSAFPGGELRGQLAPIPLLDGDLSDTQYQSLATKQNSNLGFGPDIDVTEIVYYPDLQNEILFLGIKGKLDTTNNNGIGFWLDFSELTGAPMGTSLGGSPAAGHYMGNTGNAEFKADFEVDYMFAFNPGGGTENIFLDAVKFAGGFQADYLGSTAQDGTVAFGPPDELDNEGNGAFFNYPGVAFAFNNAGTGTTGFELAIPFEELGVTGDAFRGSSSVSAFAFVVSSTAFFSDVTVPGNVTGGNPGFNVDFGAISGGPYHATDLLPVELTGFDATVIGDDVRLAWATASETNNAGFEVQMAAPDGDFETLTFAPGNGTTTEAQTYAYTASGLAPGSYRFRLKQIDFDGAFEFSGTVEVAVGLPGTHALSDAYPNPFNPQAQFTLAVARTQDVTVTLHDVLGRTLATLFSGPLEAGQTRTFTLDGAGLPSGLYTYRIAGESFTDARSVTLLK